MGATIFGFGILSFWTSCKRLVIHGICAFLAFQACVVPQLRISSATRLSAFFRLGGLRCDQTRSGRGFVSLEMFPAAHLGGAGGRGKQVCTWKHIGPMEKKTGSKTPSHLFNHELLDMNMLLTDLLRPNFDPCQCPSPGPGCWRLVLGAGLIGRAVSCALGLPTVQSLSGTGPARVPDVSPGHEARLSWPQLKEEHSIRRHLDQPPFIF